MIKNIEFKTSSSTGSTQKASTGEALANLVIGAIDVANKYSNFQYTQGVRAKQQQEAIKSENEEQDKLLLSDLKFATLKKIRESDFANQTSENQTKIIDEISNMQRPQFFNQKHENDYNTILENYRLDINKKAFEENKNNISDNIIPNIAQNSYLMNMNEIDYWSKQFNSMGVNDSKTKIIKSIVGQIDGVLQSDEKYKSMSKEQILNQFPVLNEIKDEDLKSVLNARITSYDEEFKKKAYTSTIENAVTYKKVNPKIISDIALKNQKTYVQVSEDINKQIDRNIEALSSAGDSVYDRKAVELAKNFNRKIPRVEDKIKGLINSAIVDSVSGFEDYNYAKRMLQAGYIPSSENVKDLNIITGIANDLGINISDANSFERVVNFAIEKRDNPNQQLTKKELDEFKFESGIFGSKLKSLDEGINKAFVYDKAKELSKYMSKEQAINTALDLSSKYILGTDKKTDWSGIDNIKTNDDSDKFYKYVSSTENLDDVNIVKMGDNYAVVGKLKDGSATQTQYLTTQEMNARVNRFIDMNNERKLYEDSLNAKNDLYKEMKSVAENKTVVRKAIFNLTEKEGNGDKATNITTGNFGVTAEKKKELEYKYNKLMTDAEARDVIMAENNTTLEQGLLGYKNLSDNAKIAVLDSMYNLGSFNRLNDFKEAVKNGDETKALLNLLDTANIKGQSSIGLAKRRAINYNTVAKVKINRITQGNNGTLSYYDENGELIFEYTPKNGRHESSKSNEINL